MDPKLRSETVLRDEPPFCSTRSFFFLAFSVIAKAMGLVLTKDRPSSSPQLSSSLLSPGMLLSIPPGSKGLCSCRARRVFRRLVVHALVFATRVRSFEKAISSVLLSDHEDMEYLVYWSRCNGRIFSMLGYLKNYRAQSLDNIKEYSGASAGAIICLPVSFRVWYRSTYFR